MDWECGSSGRELSQTPLIQVPVPEKEDRKEARLN
jgi:hypothetical protein